MMENVRSLLVVSLERGEDNVAIKKCSCEGFYDKKNGSKYQDKKYGKGQRVHTPDKSIPIKYTCTVCGVKKVDYYFLISFIRK